METLSEMEIRHEKELQELSEKVKLMLKSAKKATKAQVEAEAIQMQFDLKARHREEIEELEELGLHHDSSSRTISKPTVTKELEESLSEDRIAAQKKAKAKRKQDKRSQKEKEREEKKSEILDSVVSIASLRDLEINGLKEKLDRERLQIRDIPSDGHCLYRAIADQLSLTNDHSNHQKGKKGKVIESPPAEPTLDFRQLRQMAATYIRSNAAEFAPFIGFSPEDEEFEAYCQRVASETLAEWGGQLEIRALSECLARPIFVYSASAPVLKMGEDLSSETRKGAEIIPLKISYHRHLYTLGEHYNSLVPLCC